MIPTNEISTRDGKGTETNDLISQKYQKVEEEK